MKRSLHWRLVPLAAVLCLDAFAGEVIKVVIQKPLQSLAGEELVADYGSYRIALIDETVVNELTPSDRARVRAVPEMDRIEFQNYPFDTQREVPLLPEAYRALAAQGQTLQLVQFRGPVKQQWLETLAAIGAEPVHYVSNNGYLVWAGDNARLRLSELVDENRFLQYSQLHQPFFKLGDTLLDRAVEMKDPNLQLKVTIQMLNHPQKAVTETAIGNLILNRFTSWSPILKFQNLIATIRLGDLPEITAMQDVVWVGERLPRELNDEVQNQIMAGNFDGTMTGPDAPGYLAFLDGLGFSDDPIDYPIVDITDDGIGPGMVNSGDPTLHQFGDLANPTRLAYVDNCTGNPNGESVGGHGHINTSIAGGYDIRTGDPFQDADGYNLGLGINPYGLMAGTRIFGPGFDLSGCGGTDTGLIQNSYQAGAQISSNSWGCSGCAGSYDDSSQAFDVGVRDADLDAADNQELIIIFSAGNSGPGGGTVGTPGNGKNMITVGASENDRPTWTDGCAVGPTGADNAMDVIGFSSRGPSPGNRAKPEVIGPGTHIQGTASTSASYNGGSVCDQFHPPGQNVFAASSGTSHSTPAVSGIASLIWYWMENVLNFDRGGVSPSPAIMKAYIMAHSTTYLTGVGANDDLPSNSQGYGMPSITDLFDDSVRFLHDQTEVLDNSGESFSIIGSVADTSKPLRIAMAYTDQAGMIGTSPQVNDLNLEVIVNGDTYLGNNFSGPDSVMGGSADADNNYEAVFLPAGVSGSVEIRVHGFNIAGDGVPNSGDDTDQDFAVVAYNFGQEPDFFMRSTPRSLAICTPDDAEYQLEIGSILGFTDPVVLTVSGHPAGTTMSIDPNPVNPPSNTTLTIGNTGVAAAGSYTLELMGTSTTDPKTLELTLDVFDSVPGMPVLSQPVNGATDVILAPLLEWNPATQGTEYSVELASDAGFSNILFSADTPGTSAAVSVPLDPVTTYFWRVNSTNICGTGAHSAVFSFTTRPIPPILLVDDDDNGPDVQTTYTDTLDSMGLNYDVWDTNNSDNEPSALDLAPYQVVIWFTGDEFGGASGPGTAGEAALASFLDNNGCLFLTSQDYFFDRSLTSFMQTYLGVSSVNSDEAQTVATGATGSFFDGLGPYNLVYPFSNFSDIITGDGSGQNAFDGDMGLLALQKQTPEYVTAYLTFPLEAIPSQGDRAAVLQAFLDQCNVGGACQDMDDFLNRVSRWGETEQVLSLVECLSQFL